MTEIKFDDVIDNRNIKNSTMTVYRACNEFRLSISNGKNKARYNLSLTEAKELAYFIKIVLKEKEEDTFPF